MLCLFLRKLFCSDLAIYFLAVDSLFFDIFVARLFLKREIFACSFLLLRNQKIMIKNKISGSKSNNQKIPVKMKLFLFLVKFGAANLINLISLPINCTSSFLTPETTLPEFDELSPFSTFMSNSFD